MEKQTFQKERLEEPEVLTLSSVLHKNRYLWAAKFSKNKKVLDIACGTGYGMNILTTKGKAKKIIGGDNSQEALKIAKQKYSAFNTIFVNVDANKKLPFKKNYFDLVVSFETIEHLKNYSLFISEIKRILKPKGIFLISTPHKRFHTPLGRKPANYFHTKEWYPQELYNFLKKYFYEVKLFKQLKIKKPFQRMLYAFIQGKIIAPFWDKLDPQRKGKLYELIKIKIFDKIFPSRHLSKKDLKKILKNTLVQKGNPKNDYLVILAKCRK